MRNAHGLEVPGSAGSSRLGTDFSECSSFCSGKVLDQCIDGEQQQEMSRPLFSKEPCWKRKW